MADKIKKIVLAYSGGLDTSIIIPWLKEHYDGAEIVGICTNVGQDEDFDTMEERALASGASKLYIRDVREEFVTDYLFPMLRAARSTRASTCSAPPSRVRCRRSTRSRSRSKRAPTRSRTDARARATTRSASSSPTRRSRRT